MYLLALALERKKNKKKILTKRCFWSLLIPGSGGEGPLGGRTEIFSSFFFLLFFLSIKMTPNVGLLKRKKIKKKHLQNFFLTKPYPWLPPAPWIRGRLLF